MTDTVAEMEEVYRSRLMGLSGEERFLRGARMFEAAREMVISSLPLDTDGLEVKVALLKRFYTNDFNADELVKAEEAIRGKEE